MVWLPKATGGVRAGTQPCHAHYFLPDTLQCLLSQEGLENSAESVISAVEGQLGVVVAGSTFVSPEGSSSSGNAQSSSSSGSSSSNDFGYGYGYGHGADEAPPLQQIRFRGLEPSKGYVVSLCTESNSGTLSKVTVADAEAHAEAPLVRLQQ